MSTRKAKTCDLTEAVQSVPDGARIALGGFAIYQRPMAFVHELIRVRRRNLTVVGVTNGPEVDMLAGAGCLGRIETSYVGLEQFGLANMFRRVVERGELEVIDYPELLSVDRFRADQENLPFWPVSYLGGSDVVRRNQDIKPFSCPVTGRQMWAVPSAKVDVVVLHANAGDKYGNIQMPDRHLLPQSVDATLSRSCDTLIVTVDRLIDTEEIKAKPHLTFIPAFRTKYVVEVPWGAHPTPVLGAYQTDSMHFQSYVAASASEKTFHDYIEKYILGVVNFDGYLDLVGRERLVALKEGGAL